MGHMTHFDQFLDLTLLLHYCKAGDEASSVELLDDLRFILSRYKESRRRTSCFIN